MADPERAASRRHEGKRGKRSLELPEALAEAGIGSLLPTPGRLLPTPTAEDGERGRNGSGTDRLGVSTFDALLPTPVANEENPGAGGELRAAVVHGEGRRNETGTDTLGRPNTGRPSRLLPTPTAADGENASEQGPRHYVEGTDNPTLLGAARRASGELRHSDDPSETSESRPTLLPTPNTGESASGHGRRGGKAGNGKQSGADPDAVIEHAAPVAEGIAWGVYEAAIRRWERIHGRGAPAPTDEKGRLAPAFVEWMLGYPPGWISDIDIPRTAQLRILGNSVQVQASERVGEWLASLALTGVI